MIDYVIRLIPIFISSLGVIIIVIKDSKSRIKKIINKECEMLNAEQAKQILLDNGYSVIENNEAIEKSKSYFGEGYAVIQLQNNEFTAATAAKFLRENGYVVYQKEQAIKEAKEILSKLNYFIGGNSNE